MHPLGCQGSKCPNAFFLTNVSLLCRSVIEVRNGKTFLDLIVEQIEVLPINLVV